MSNEFIAGLFVIGLIVGLAHLVTAGSDLRAEKKKLARWTRGVKDWRR